jgi:hypothetical protein
MGKRSVVGLSRQKPTRLHRTRPAMLTIIRKLREPDPFGLMGVIGTCLQST